MRRNAVLALALIAGLLPGAAAMAQPQGGGGGGDDDAQRRQQRDQEWNQEAPPLPQLRNAGPCPFVKVLYDAGRIVEFANNQEASAQVAYTGEIEGVSAGCAYKDAEPIRVSVNVLFNLGRGPQGTGNQRTYRYWVAVTQRNKAVLAKEYFDLPVTFQPGQDRVMINEELGEIVIPRANLQVSGSNFEVLIGFDVTPAQAAFNRDGKRFRINAGQGTTPAAAPAPPAAAPGPTPAP